MASPLDCNSKGETLQSSSEATAGIWGRSLQAQVFGAAPKCVNADPKDAMSPGVAAFWDADGSEGLLLTAIQVYNVRVRCNKSKQIWPYVLFETKALYNC